MHDAVQNDYFLLMCIMHFNFLKSTRPADGVEVWKDVQICKVFLVILFVWKANKSRSSGNYAHIFYSSPLGTQRVCVR